VLQSKSSISASKEVPEPEVEIFVVPLWPISGVRFTWLYTNHTSSKVQFSPPLESKPDSTKAEY
jgi:hypothetical protein